MALPGQNLPVPVGKGIDQSVDEFRLAPPASQDVNGFRIPSGDALTKSLGWENHGSGSVTVGDGAVVAPIGSDGVAAFGSLGMSVWQGNPPAPVTVTTGVPVASRVIRHEVFRPSGRLEYPNIAHNHGFTAVVVNEVFDTTTASGYVSSRKTHLLVLDSSWILVGHATWTGANYFHTPRVEGYYDSVGPRVGFVLTGLTADGAHLCDLKADTVWLESSWVAKGIQTLKSNLYASEDSGVVVYDSHADGDAHVVYSCSVDHAAVPHLHRLITTWNPSTGVPSGLIDTDIATLSLAGSSQERSCVFYDAANNWVLVYCDNVSTATTLYYVRVNGTGAGTLVLPNLPESDAWAPHDDWTIASAGTGPREAVCFWRDNLLKVRLPKNIITVTSNPPTAAGTTTYFTTLHRRPQPANTTGLFITFGIRDESRNDLPVWELNRPSFGEADVRVPYNSTTESHLVGLGTSQRAVNFDGGAGNRDLCGQSCIGATSQAYLIPMTVPEPNIHPQAVAFVNADGTYSTGTNLVPPAQFGLDSGGEQLVVAEVRLGDGIRSYIDFGETSLVAAGALISLDGDSGVPAWLDRPSLEIPTSQPSDLDNNASGTASDRGVERWGRLWVEDASKERALAFVLVHTDRNGFQTRSQPFYSATHILDTGAVWTRHVAVDAATYYPAIWGKAFIPQHLVMHSAKGTLRMEVYMTEAYLPGTDEVPEQYFLSCVSWVDSSGYFVIRDDLGPFVSAADGPAEASTASAFSTRPSQVALYTVTDLAAHRPPATNVIAAAGNYVFLIPSENPQTYWVSKPLEKARVPEWSAELSYNAPAGAGDVVSVAGMGDRAFLLCERGVWEVFVGGGGPDATGAGQFSAPRKIYSKDGCLNHNTTVSGVWGVFYVTESGPKLILPSGDQNDIGKRVIADMDVTDLVAAVYDERNREIWLFADVSTDKAWVYNLETDAWTRVPFGTTQAAEFDSGVLRYISSDASLRKQSTTSMNDGSNSYYLGSIVSPWVSLGDIEGFKRVRKINLLINKLQGTYGTLRISLAYDYVDTDVQSEDWTWTAITALDNPHVVGVKPGRQKCAAVRVTITDVAQDIGSVGNPDLRHDVRWTLSGYELELGMKKGTLKVEQGAKK